MFCSVHTADFRAVALSSVVCAAASHTLDKYHFLRRFSIRKTLKMSFCRSCRIHDTLKLKGSDDVLALAVCVLVIFIELDHIKTSCHYNSSVFLCHDLVLLVVFNGSCLTDFRTETAFSCFKLDAVFSVNDRHIWNCLSKRCVNGCSVSKSSVKLARDFFGRTFFLTDTAACTLVHIYASCFFANVYCEVTYESGYFFHFAVCINIDFFVSCRFHHFRCQNTGRTVKCREGLVKL